MVAHTERMIKLCEQCAKTIRAINDAPYEAIQVGPGVTYLRPKAKVAKKKSEDSRPVKRSYIGARIRNILAAAPSYGKTVKEIQNILLHNYKGRYSCEFIRSWLEIHTDKVTLTNKYWHWSPTL